MDGALCGCREIPPGESGHAWRDEVFRLAIFFNPDAVQKPELIQWMSNARSDRSRGPNIVNIETGADCLESVKEFSRVFVDRGIEEPYGVGVHVVRKTVAQQIRDRLEELPSFCLAVLSGGSEEQWAVP